MMIRFLIFRCCCLCHVFVAKFSVKPSRKFEKSNICQVLAGSRLRLRGNTARRSRIWSGSSCLRQSVAGAFEIWGHLKSLRLNSNFSKAGIVLANWPSLGCCSGC